MLSGQISARGLVLLGCGKMGSALLQGWINDGLDSRSVWVIDPNPSDWLQDQGVHINDALPDDPAVVVIAVKPQMMDDALPRLQTFSGKNTLFITVAAGTSLASYEKIIGENTAIIRTMPNTPAAIGCGVTAIVGNSSASQADVDLAETLMSAVGQVVILDTEGQMDAVTGVSGSGPAYVFHMIESLAAAGQAQGLSAELAMMLAKATVSGAATLAELSQEGPGQLRMDVTSPNGTTQAGLDVLMQALPDLMRQTVSAATNRSKELSRR